MHEKLTKLFKIEFVRYLLVGGLNTVVGFLSFRFFVYALTQNFQSPDNINAVSAVLGQFLGIIFSYVLNSKFTFKKRLSISGFIAFAGPLLLLQLIVMGGGMKILLQYLQWNENIVFILLTGVNVILGFLIARFALKKVS